jgi:3-isopropylmalate/(R)-2-methylmalate dehydratase small subunit
MWSGFLLLGTISGPVAVFGDFIAADTVLPARHGFLPASEATVHVLAELGVDANARVRSRPILLVGEAFGYGTGRESPARALKAAGVRALIGVSFARMFYRNAVNNGILPIVCGELALAGVKDGDFLEIDTGAAIVRWRGREFRVAQVPPLLRQIVLAGDLIAHGRNVLGGETNA